MSTQNFNCSVCLVDRREFNPRLIHDSFVCHACVLDYILPLFHSALDYEHKYPPSWGSTPLNVLDFARLLGNAFVERYQRREVEYKVNPNHRIYCKHKLIANIAPLVGTTAPQNIKLALTPGQINEMQASIPLIDCGALVSSRSQDHGPHLLCYHCNGLTCTRCESVLERESQPHDCVARDNTSPDSGLQGQVRGRDYQLCPGCQYPIALAEGCNSICCTFCESDFCFICGEHVDHDSDHWLPGNPCPRYNQPGAENAQYDEFDDDDDDDDEVIDEAEAIQRFLNAHAQPEVIDEAEAIRRFLNAHAQADGHGILRANHAFVDVDGDGFGPEGIEEAMEAPPLWQVLMQAQRLIERNRRLEQIGREVTLWAIGRGFEAQRDRVAAFMQIADTLIDNLDLLHSIRRGEEPPEGFRNDFVTAHNEIVYVMNNAPRDLVEDHFPALDALANEYYASIPHWIWNGTEED